MNAVITPTNIVVVIKNNSIQEQNGEHPISLQTQRNCTHYTFTRWDIPIELNQLFRYHSKRNNVLAILLNSNKRVVFTLDCKGTDGSNLTFDDVTWSV